MSEKPLIFGGETYPIIGKLVSADQAEILKREVVRVSLAETTFLLEDTKPGEKYYDFANCSHRWGYSVVH